MNRIGVRAAAALAAVLLLGATACGGGSKDESSSDGDAIKATAESTTTTDGASADVDGIDDLGDAMDALGGDCMQAGLAYFALSMQALGASFGASESDLEEMRSSIDELRADIPEEIEADFDVYAEALQEYGEAMSGLDMGDLLSGESDAEDASAILETPEVTQAQENIDAYFDEHCPS